MAESLDHKFFHKYFNNFTHFDAKQFDLALEHCQNYASQYGLSEEDLILLSKVAFDQINIGVTRLRKIVKCMIPRRSVPDIVVENVLDWLLENFNKNVSQYSKNIILQWLRGVVIYKLIDPSKTVNLYYEIFWYLLPHPLVNTSAAHLIYLLAKPNDVNRWYVKQVLKVHDQFQQPKFTGALLLLFKSYRPEMVPENIPAYAVHKAFGILPEFITNNFSKAQEVMESQNMIFKNVEGICWYTNSTRNVKKQAVELIPKITECEALKFDRQKTLTSFTDIKNLHEYLLEGNLPTSALSLLSCTEGMFILIFGDKKLQNRLSIQLYYTLYDAFFERNPNVSYEERDNLLKKVSELQNYLQQGIPVVSKFLGQYLIQWDGKEHEKYIYELLEWINFPNFDVLEDCVLIFLYDLFISGNVQTKCNILRCLGKLCVNIITTFHNRRNLDLKFLFLDNCNVVWDFMKVIEKLYNFLISLFQIALMCESLSLILYTIIEINYMILKAEQQIEVNCWEIPEFLYYSTIFSSNPICLLGICNLFNRFPERVPKEKKDLFVNALFHKKILFTKDTFLLSDIINEFYKRNIHVSLSCEKHIALACFNYNFKAEKKNNFQEFIEHAKKNFPDVMEFLSINL